MAKSKSRTITVSIDVKERFDKVVFQKLGMKKGNPKICADEAITKYCDEHDAKIND